MKIGPFDFIEIEPGSWRIEAGMVRAWLFAGSESALLVDTTNLTADLLGAIRTITDLPIKLVNTHADEDHISCNGQFETTYMHPAEFACYAQKRQPGYASPAPLQDGEIISLGDRNFEVILIPGHTCGSIALLDKERRVLISGDSVSANPIFIFGPMRNMEALIVSLRRLQARSADFDRIYVSHGAFQVEPSQLENIILCAQDLAAGLIEPQEPPFPMPAKMYRAHGAGFYFCPEKQ
jgi:hydroxyacylglutathione hydrolase